MTQDKVRLANLARATLRLGQFQDQVMARAESWQIAARNIGSAYATAARHTDALAKQDKIEALKTQLLFSVLTVATSGTLSWVSSGLPLGEKYPERLKLIEAVEDAAQASAGEVFSAMGPLIKTSQGESVSIDPLMFQNERENAVSEAKIKVLQLQPDQALGWAASPLENWDNYTEAKQVACGMRLAEGSRHPGRQGLPAVDRRHGRRTGAGHLGRLDARAEKLPHVDDQGLLWQGGRIRERGQRDRGPVRQAGHPQVGGHGIDWYQSAEGEDKKLIAGAQGYKVKDCLSLK